MRIRLIWNKTVSLYFYSLWIKDHIVLAKRNTMNQSSGCFFRLLRVSKSQFIFFFSVRSWFKTEINQGDSIPYWWATIGWLPGSSPRFLALQPVKVFQESDANFGSIAPSLRGQREGKGFRVGGRPSSQTMLGECEWLYRETEQSWNAELCNLSQMRLLKTALLQSLLSGEIVFRMLLTEQHKTRSHWKL